VGAESVTGISLAGRIGKACREEHRRILAALINQLGDFELEEGALEDT